MERHTTKNLILRSAIAFSMAFFATGCIPYDNLIHYQNDFLETQNFEINNRPEITIQTNDVLSIKVHSSDVNTAAPFNVDLNDNLSVINVEAIQLGGYLVDKEGFIVFPVLGKIKVKGLTTSVATQIIKEKLVEYLKDPIVNLRLLNFRVSITGEVELPGSYMVFNERLTISEAISLAGGLTPYANRSNIQLIRESDGIRTFHKIDIQNTDVFSSEYFYLRQNDLIYVEPTRSKVGAINDQLTKTIPIVTAVATLVAVIVSISSN